MNIFYISECPRECATWMVDKHIVKMILETSQLLSTAHRLLDGTMTVIVKENGRKAKRWVLNDERQNLIYHASHMHHPSAVWTRISSDNYNWLYQHFLCLLDEYTYRYDKTHASTKLIEPLKFLPNNIESKGFTLMPSAMANEYKVSKDPIINYRYYYTFGKSHLHSWKRRNPPEWLTEALNRKEYNESAIA